MINRKAYLVIISLILMLLCSSVFAADRIQLPKGKEIVLKFASDLKVSSGEYEKGDSIPVMLDQPIDIGGQIVVERGAVGTAVVLEVEKNGRGGKAGMIKVGFVNLQPKGVYKLPEGEVIPLAGDPLEFKGKKKGIFPYLFFVLLLKGGNGEVPTDVAYTVTVAETVVLEN
jgi:hypothetical protein